jgi:DNA-binding HxlR family transcriptional regulator
MKSVIENRNTLAVSLRDLRTKKLIERKIRDATPIQTEYCLTEKGKKLAESVLEIKDILEL